MKLFLLFLLVTVSSCFITAEAQYSKHIIRLRDKGNNQFTLNDGSAFLSSRALLRRTRYSIALDSADLPVSRKYLDSIAATGQVTILGTSKWLNQVLIQTTDQSALNKINQLRFVVSSQPIGLRQANPLPDKFQEEVSSHQANEAVFISRTKANRYNYGSSYNQVHIHEGEYLHNLGFKGESIHIAVLDAGFSQYKTITAFDSIRMNGQVLGERDFVAFDNSVNEDNSHGMQCLSIMAANWPGRMVGTAPKASYWLLRTENAASEYPVEEHNWVAGAEFADSAGSDMISSSLGYYSFDDPSFDHSYSDFYKNATPISKGAAMAVRKGMIVMNSAGNEGANSWKYLGFPADNDSVCAVGAIDTLGRIANFSSYGYPGKVKPNIVSVGVSTIIAGFNNQPASGNGTSFSNPNVAGLIACLWQAFPQFNNMQILDAVYRSADRYGNPTDRFGFGIPNFRIAYQILHKQAGGSIISFDADWIVAAPNPFRDELNVHIMPPATGKAEIRLLDAAGHTLRISSFQATQNLVHTASFNTGALPAGVYLVQYISGKEKKVKKVLKY